MSLFGKILKYIFGAPRTLQDDLFGEMLDADGYYECFAYFQPINKKIELGIGGDSDGPTKEARAYYKKVEKEYFTLLERIAPFIQEDLKKWSPEVEIKVFEKEFEPVYLFIPDCRATEIKWTIAFETIHDSHLFTIEMNGNVPESLVVDG